MGQETVELGGIEPPAEGLARRSRVVVELAFRLLADAEETGDLLTKTELVDWIGLRWEAQWGRAKSPSTVRRTIDELAQHGAIAPFRVSPRRTVVRVTALGWAWRDGVVAPWPWPRGVVE